MLGAAIQSLVAWNLFTRGPWCITTAIAAATTTALQLDFIDCLINWNILETLYLWNWFCYKVSTCRLYFNHTADELPLECHSNLPYRHPPVCVISDESEIDLTCTFPRTTHKNFKVRKYDVTLEMRTFVGGDVFPKSDVAASHKLGHSPLRTLLHRHVIHTTVCKVSTQLHFV
jgi:hypothetical protein